MHIVCIYTKTWTMSFDKSDTFLLTVSVWLLPIDISSISLQWIQWTFIDHLKNIEWQITNRIELSNKVIYGTCWQMYFEYVNGQLSENYFDATCSEVICLMFDRERSHYERTVISWLPMIFTIFDSKILKTKIKNKTTKLILKRTSSQIKIL